MGIWGILVFLQVLIAASADNDFTCFSYPSTFSLESSVYLQGSGPGKLPIEFGIYHAAGRIEPLDEGNDTIRYQDSELIALSRDETSRSDSRTGVFSCTSSSDPSITILVINHRSGSNVLPDGFVTKTVGLGDTVTLSVNSRSSKIRWRKGGRKVPQWNGLKSVTLYNVSEKDEGIYQAYTCIHKPHAYMRLIVRDCPGHSFGPNCDEFCTCYNGGVCSDSGDCICPPGYSGVSCEIVHSADCYGAECQYEFPQGNGGHLACLPDPYGCSCSNGYRGLDCSEECEEGTFGPDCTQTCHCGNGSSCDGKTGRCSPEICLDGWTGVNCNEKINCGHQPCENGAMCEDDLELQEYQCICLYGYYGKNCEHFDGAEVRLVGGADSSQGRVEVYRNGEWGTVCDDKWDDDDATVICRQLGIGEYGVAVCCAGYGPGTDPILLDEVACQGSEHNIGACPSDGWGNNNCAHNEDAGVRCVSDVDVRLVSGSSAGEGRVEVYYDNSWGTVCDDSWDDVDASVICQQLGLGHSGTAVCCANWGEGSGSIWLDNVVCSGSESNIGACGNAGWGVENCEHSEDAGVRCIADEGAVRLTGGSSTYEGRVEIFHNSQWGTVCDDYWDDIDATVVCGQLGLGNSGTAVLGAAFGQGKGYTWLDNVSCTGSESNLSECGHRGWATEDCNHSEDAGVICVNRDQL